MATKKYYIIKRGRTNGIVDSWALCKESTERFPGAKYWGFSSILELFIAIRSLNWDYIQRPILIIDNHQYKFSDSETAINIICKNSPTNLQEYAIESANHINLDMR